MDINDLLFSRSVSMDVKHAILEIVNTENISSGFVQVLTPTATNNDTNGSQHGDGDTDFTYRDVTESDLSDIAALGYYEYFSGSRGHYTGHYYDGGGRHFDALVINPPAYAISQAI